MKKYSLEIAGFEVEISPKPIKNMYLRIIPPHAQVCVSAPLGFSLQKIRNQVEAKREWIQQNRNRILSSPNRSPLLLQNGEVIYFLGNSYRLQILEGVAKSSIQLHDSHLELRVKSQATQHDMQKILQTWYRNEMQTLLPTLIEKWQHILGVKINQWGIKRMRTRWGSCNIREKRIWLNLALIKKPIA